MFADRSEAGRALAERVAALAPERPVVLALPRGGVPVAAEVARRLKAPLGLVLVRKIGVPGHEELAAGAVAEGEPPATWFNTALLRSLAMSERDFDARLADKLGEIAERRRLYLGGRPRPEVRGAAAILVDDGIATGATVKAALRALGGRGAAEVILAVPVAAAETLDELRPLVSRIVCLETPDPFHAVGLHYRSFPQTTDAEVIALLDEANAPQGR